MARYVSTPDGTLVPMAPHQLSFWDWIWGLVPGVRPRPLVAIWARGAAKSTSAEMGATAICALKKRKYGLYICSTQDRADDHVTNVSGMLELPGFAKTYPLAASRMVGKYGRSKGWRRNRLRTASGFTLDAIGLDVASRGAKMDEARPDIMILDDIDEALDTPLTTSKKIQILSHNLLPAGSRDLAVVAVQNQIIPNGVFSRIADGRAEFLRDRVLSGPIPAILELSAEQDRTGRWRVLGGTPTWVGHGLAEAEALMNTIGYTAYLHECQHEVDDPPGGMYDHIKFAHIERDALPELISVVGWVDPAVTDTDESDSQGIQVDGLGVDQKIYRLWSFEDRLSPKRTIELAILKVCEYRGAAVGIETNQGGDLWEEQYVEIAKRLKEEDQISYIPEFRSAKAGSGDGPKTHRQSLQLTEYEKGRFVHVIGSDRVLERALKRFPKTAPLDLADASYWAWTDLQELLDSLTRTHAVPVGIVEPSLWDVNGGLEDRERW